MSDFLILRLDKSEDGSLFLKQVASYIDAGYEVAAGNYEFERGRAWVMIVRRATAALPGGRPPIREQQG